MPIAIAPITVALIDQFHAVLGIVARERKYLARDDAPSIERSHEFVRANMAAGNPHLVAMDGDMVVGWCDIRRGETFNSTHVGTLGMGLLPDYRGRGIGRLLIEATIVAAKAASFTRIALSVNASNLNAIRLYEKVGFVREGVLRDAIRTDGVYQDTWLMAIVDRSAVDL